MEKKNFLKRFVETLRATSLLGMMLLAAVTVSAQVTIGSGNLPQATLDIVGAAGETGKAFRLDDGNQAPDKVLTCGENGVGTWQVPMPKTRVTTGILTAADGWQVSSQGVSTYGDVVTLNGRFIRTGSDLTVTNAGGDVIGTVNSDYTAYSPMAVSLANLNVAGSIAYAPRGVVYITGTNIDFFLFSGETIKTGEGVTFYMTYIRQ